ncbi:MAG: hypothetical protein K2P14_03600 [Anaeroplasmataceae bacterium]|nr:hypothetical protein [Anaeroplasmataceae bacterium]
MKYYIADLHFGHKNILKFENRPFETVEEMTEGYVQIWNNKIKKGDEVYILGDFSFYKGEETNKILKRLNGQKFLIKGNHDHMYLADDNFDTSLFVWIKDTHMLKDGDHRILLFHFPIQVWNKQHHGSLHFYGHVHSNTGTMHPMKYEIPNSYNVGIDILKEPMTKTEILKFYGKEYIK